MQIAVSKVVSINHCSAWVELRFLLFCSWLDSTFKRCFGELQQKEFLRFQFYAKPFPTTPFFFKYYSFTSLSHVPRNLQQEARWRCEGSSVTTASTAHTGSSWNPEVNTEQAALHDRRRCHMKKDAASFTDKQLFFCDHFWYSVVLSGICFVMI